MISMSTLTFRKSFVYILYASFYFTKYIIDKTASQEKIVYMDIWIKRVNSFAKFPRKLKKYPIKGRMPSKENLYLAFIMKKF